MVYVNWFTDPLHVPNCWGPEAGEEGEGGGRVEKNGGGGGGAKLEGAEMRKILRARLRNGGGETRRGRHKFTMHIILKGTRNILTRLAHLNYFFGFVLVDFTLLTWNSKKKNVHKFLYIPKQKSVYIEQGAYKKCLEMHNDVPIILKNIQEEDPEIPPFSLVFIV